MGQAAAHFNQFSWGTSGPQREPLAAFEFKENGAEFDLFVDGKQVARAAPPAYLAQFIGSKVQALLARSRPDLVFVRGDVVEVKQGVGILLAGSSFSGQTTLARAFQAPVWSSHYSVLGPDGQARRYPQLDSESLPLSLIARLAYKPGAAWSPAPLTPGPCALGLTALLEGDEGGLARALPILAMASTGAIIRLSGVRGEAQEAAHALTASL